jgi:hypothetical protein
VLDIRLNLGIVELATNKTFCIENSGEQVLGENLQDGWKNVRVVGVHNNFVLCDVANQTFVIREGDIGRSCAISLVVSTWSFCHTPTQLKHI